MDTGDHFGSKDAPGMKGSNGAGAHPDAELLGAYRDRDGAVAAATLAAVDAHLASCAECRDALRELEATIALLGALPQVAPRRSFILTPELIAASGGQVRREPRRRFGWVWPTRWASAAATLLFAVTVGLDLGGATGPVSAPVAQPTAATGAGAIFSTPAAPPAETQVSAFVVGTPRIIGGPTAAPAAAAPVSPAQPADWRVVEAFLGALAAALAFFGFGLPPLLRRRAAG